MEEEDKVDEKSSDCACVVVAGTATIELYPFTATAATLTAVEYAVVTKLSFVK